MYRIGILEKDEAYLDRLVGFLQEHHRDSFEINVVDREEADWDFLSLEDLDLEAVQYDALFFGDGIEPENGLPSGIMIGFITEKEGANEHCINKYQSLEKIYKHMLKICKDGRRWNTIKKEQKNLRQEPSIWHDPQPETVVENGETYRVYHLEETEVDRLAVRMLAANHIKGLPQTEYDSGKLKIRVTGMRSLYDMVYSDNTPEGKQELLKIFGDMINTALSLEEYMLSSDKLIMNPREIYVDSSEGEVILPYVPFKNNEKKDIKVFLEEIRGLCNVLLDGIGKEQPSAYIESEVYSKQPDNASYGMEEDTAYHSELSDSAGYGADDNSAYHSELSDSTGYGADGNTAYYSELSDSAGYGVDGKPAYYSELSDSAGYGADEKPVYGANLLDSIDDGYGETEAFENLQRNARESLKLKYETAVLDEKKKRIPYLVRKRTGEKILINRNIFKLGKDESYVDYCIRDNPTVSRNHADIVRKPDGFYVIDKGSLNHTFVNGKKLGPDEYKKLESGCLLQLADEVFEFAIGRLKKKSGT